MCACTKTLGKEKSRIKTSIGQFLGIPQSNPRALWMGFWGTEVQPVTLNPTNLPTTTNDENFSLPTDAHNVKKHRVIKTF